MANRPETIEKLRSELERCILLTDEDKKFWLENAESLPDEVLQNVLDAVLANNATVDEYIDAALAEDKDHKYLVELKAKIKKMKLKSVELEEGSSDEDADEELAEQLKDL